jgi:hypothetical protein
VSVPDPDVVRSVVEVVLLDVLLEPLVPGTTTVVGGALAGGCWFTIVVDEPGAVASVGRMAKK